ncbi:hypothetical protein [Aeromicrobium sp. UC242_57]|uniref:oxidoreductase n=1 Tax=Aeromicrobium sp. UC242_57 TaxID=3374624 RepID=UPI00378A40DC
MRYALEVVTAIREVIPDQCALFYRLSAVDGLDGGLTIEDTIEFSRRLFELGVDVIDTSSGGVTADRREDTRVRRGFAFHAPYSSQIRQATQGLVGTVGLITDARQAEAVLRAGDADIVAVGRGCSAIRTGRTTLRQPLRARTSAVGTRKQAGGWTRGDLCSLTLLLLVRHP